MNVGPKKHGRPKKHERHTWTQDPKNMNERPKKHECKTQETWMKDPRNMNARSKKHERHKKHERPKNMNTRPQLQSARISDDCIVSSAMMLQKHTNISYLLQHVLCLRTFFWLHQTIENRKKQRNEITNFPFSDVMLECLLWHCSSNFWSPNQMENNSM